MQNHERERDKGQETEIRVKSKEEKNNIQKNTPWSKIISNALRYESSGFRISTNSNRKK